MVKRTMSDEHKSKISASMKGKKKSDEHKYKISKSMKHVPKTEQHKNAISRSIRAWVGIKLTTEVDYRYRLGANRRKEDWITTLLRSVL